MKDKVIILSIIGLIIGVAALYWAVTTVPAQTADNTLSGKDIFNPMKFSMATYLQASDMGNTSTQFLVYAKPGEKQGNRITSIDIIGNQSLRGDVWIDRSGKRTNQIILTNISSQSINSQRITLPYNLTIVDDAWNTLESTYTLVGYDNITTPAGEFDNCAIYGTKKTLMDGDTPVDLTVLYYMNKSEPVPVSYVVQYPGANVIYGLESAYGPNDVDSTPERVVSSYINMLNDSDYAQASDLLVKINKDGSISPLSSQDRSKMESNMAQTYGGYIVVQYVLVDSVKPASAIDGHAAEAAHWTSVQYIPATGMGMILDKVSQVVNVNGHWKIVADDL